MRILLLLFLLFCYCPGGLVIGQQTDDLRRIYASQTGDQQILTGLQICDSLMEDPDSGLPFSKELLEKARNTKPGTMLLARVERAVADGYFYADSLEKSNEHMLLAIQIAENQKSVDSLFLANAYNDLGMNFSDLEEFQPAREYLNRAIRIFRGTDQLKGLSDALSNLAAVHAGKGEFEEAISLFSQAHEIDIKTGNRDLQSSSLNSLGRMYVEWGKYQTGLEYYQRSIMLMDTVRNRDNLAIRYNNIGMVYQLMGQHREAIQYLNKAMVIDAEMGNIPKISIRHYNLGNSYLALGDIGKARYSFEQAEAFFVRTRMYSKVSKVYGSLGQLWLTAGNPDLAEDYFLRSREMAERGDALPEKFQSYLKLNQFYKEKGDYRNALYYLELQTQAEDSLYNLKASKQIEELEARYQNEKKEAEIVRLESDNALKIKELLFRKRERNLAFAGISILLLFLAGLLYLLATVRKQRSTLLKQNQELDRLTHTQNRLFGIISHDLRNVSAAYLASAKIIEYNLNKGQPERLLPVAAEISRNARNLSSMLESLLHWAVIQIKGIEPEKQTIPVREEFEHACTLVREMAESKSVSLVVEAGDESVWCDPESLRLMIRNLVGNALKFTSDGTITLSAAKSDGMTILSIKDTGCGIASENISSLFEIGKGRVRTGTAGEKGTGLGLFMVAEHVAKNGGTIQVESEENIGTKVSITLPAGQS